MSDGLEYDERVRYLILASIARCRRLPLLVNFFSFNSFAFIFVSLFVFTGLVSTGLAQNGGGSSGGHSGGGGSASVSFSGSHVASGAAGFGFSGRHGSGFSSNTSGSNGSESNHGSPHSNPAGNSNGNHPHHHHPPYYGGGYAGPVWYAVPYPYIEDDSADYDDADADANTDDSDADYQGGPTVFDRRGSGAGSYVPPVEDVSQPHTAIHTDADETPQRPTLLVFKDGHEIEVGNYAIVGVTLFDLTPGHARRVALADLDLEATQKKNEDRGVIFAIPSPAQAN
jgi:hypothetical protein